MTFMMKNTKSWLLGLGMMSAMSAQAKIYLDTVVDPIPLVEIQVVLPKGTFNSDLKNMGAAEVLPLILESGSKNRNKQQLQDSLAAFGANISINVGSQFSYVNVEFPYIENKNYDELFSILKEAIFEPRFDEATLKLAKSKLRNSIESLVDKDSALLHSMIRDWQFFKVFKKKPMTLEDVDTLTLKEVQDFYLNKVLVTENAWIGLVTPPTAKDALVTRVAALFAKQGAVTEGVHLEPMIAQAKGQNDFKPSKTFFIIDKKERTQTIFAVNALLSGDFKADHEMDFRMGNYVLVGSGMGSTLMDVIRTQNGFAYYVSPFESKLMGQPSFGFSTNPVSARSLQAFKTIADLIGTYYQDSKEAFATYKDDFWATRVQAFRYSEMMDRASEIKKLGRRKLVVLGEISPDYYKADPKKWQIKSKDVGSFFEGIFDKSMVVAGAVGDVNNLESIVKLNFPGYQVIKLSARDAITAKPYK